MIMIQWTRKNLKKKSTYSDNSIGRKAVKETLLLINQGVAEQIKKRENDEEEDFDRVWNEPWVERKGEKSWNRQHKKW